MSAAKAIAADLRPAAQCLKDARLRADNSSRNAAYLASQAAEHLVRAVSTSEGIHIERAKAHLIDTNVRALPDENQDKQALAEVSMLESYATTYRYPTPAGRIVPAPEPELFKEKLDKIEKLLRVFSRHFQVDTDGEGSAITTHARR